MLHILHGDDDFSIHEALEALKVSVGLGDLDDGNLIKLEVSSVSAQEVQSMCQTVPFLADSRMIVLRGLLAALENKRSKIAVKDWQPIFDNIPNFPESTQLVLVDKSLSDRNSMLRQLGAIGMVRKFPSLNSTELRRWVKERVKAKGCDISEKSVELLTQLVGPNLWVMESEIEKLSLYCSGNIVEVEDISGLVSSARDVNIFDAVDAIIGKEYDRAIKTMRDLVKAGSGTMIIVMIARQVRILLLAKDLERRQIPLSKWQERLGLRGEWMIKRIRNQGSGYSYQLLADLLEGLLEADFLIKTGALVEDDLGQFLVGVFANFDGLKAATSYN
jgi:DNA polymerase-3 subunit delta